MVNKYLYSFLKDIPFRSVCIFPVIVAVLCLILVRLSLWQDLSLKDIEMKRALIDQIPAWEDRIGQKKVLVNGVTFILNGIISDKDQQIAVVNNTLLKVGDKIEDKMVSTITEHTVTLCDVKSAGKCIKLLLES